MMENGWVLEIEKVDNGFILKNTEDIDSDSPFCKVIQEEDVEAYTFQKLLRGVCEYFGYHPSKHDEKVCRIVVETNKVK